MNSPMVNEEKKPPRTATAAPINPPAKSAPTEAISLGVMFSCSSSELTLRLRWNVSLTQPRAASMAAGRAATSADSCCRSSWPNAAKNTTANSTTEIITTPVASPRFM